jgi:hypothetical protein
MATPFPCPTCAHELLVPDVLLGRRVKCPRCGALFPAGDPPPGEPEAAAEPAAVTPLAEPLPAEAASVACRFCSERIPVTAARCPACGEHQAYADDVADLPPWETGAAFRRDAEPHRGGVIQAVAIGGMVTPFVSGALWCIPLLPLFGQLLGLGLSITAIVMAHRDLKRMEKGEVDPEGRGSTHAGLTCGYLGLAFSTLGLLTCGLVQAAYLGRWR